MTGNGDAGANLSSADAAVAVARSSKGPVVELHRVRKTYFKPDGTVMVEALKGVDLAVTHGESVAVMGASGSGKSTLMNILGCLDRPTFGTYRLDSQDVERMSDAELSNFRGRKIGFIFQAFNLIPQETVLDNVALPLLYQGIRRDERLRRAGSVLTKVGLGDRLEHRPRELSGGQQQRVAIARALVMNPVVLMADEPTGNLDSKTGAAILHLFHELHTAGMTILMVTHDENVARRCERVVRLRDGVVESDVRQVPVIPPPPPPESFQETPPETAPVEPDTALSSGAAP